MEGRPDAATLESRLNAAVERGETGAALEVFRAGYRLFEEKGPDAVGELLTEDFELKVKSLLLDTQRSYRGLDGFKAWRADIADALEYDHFRAQAVRFGPGETVAVLGTLEYKGRSSGFEGTTPITHVFEMRDGKFARQTMYDDAREALASIGIVDDPPG